MKRITNTDAATVNRSTQTESNGDTMKKRLSKKTVRKMTKREKIFLGCFTAINVILALIVKIYDGRQLKRMVSDPELIKALESCEKTEKVS